MVDGSILERIVEKEDDVITRPVPFNDFLDDVAERPRIALRNIYQFFSDMVNYYVGEGYDEFPQDEDNINFRKYDMSKLLEDSNKPFFADILFSNRLVNLAKSMKTVNQQKKIHIFDGPPGAGKTVFMTNLLDKIEEYSKTDDGTLYEIVWMLDQKKILEKSGGTMGFKTSNSHDDSLLTPSISDSIEVPCPSHTNPITLIPKNERKELLDDLIKDDEFKKELFESKEYDWVFNDDPTAINSIVFDALKEKVGSKNAYSMLYARRYVLNRKRGHGISVFNTGHPSAHDVRINPRIQKELDNTFGPGKVRYEFSPYSNTNNGTYVLMDLKDRNLQRFKELHGVISDGVVRVNNIEENVNSIFFAVKNPGDALSTITSQEKEDDKDTSFIDRIDHIPMNMVLDYNTEKRIYRDTFGESLETSFLPGVLDIFAKMMVSTRMGSESDAIGRWINNFSDYEAASKNLKLLLKIELYAGNLPDWVKDKDRKSFNQKVRKKIIEESIDEPTHEGISDRKSPDLLDMIMSSHNENQGLITMAEVHDSIKKNVGGKIPSENLDLFVRQYDNMVLDHIKYSMNFYDRKHIAADIKDYLHAINFSKHQTIRCPYTRHNVHVTGDYLRSIELRIFDHSSTKDERLKFMEGVKERYVSETLAQEIGVEGKDIEDTALFKELFRNYEYNSKERSMDPFIDSKSFRSAIFDYNDPDKFKTYDNRIKKEVKMLMNNLKKDYSYSQEGARDVCLYVLEKKDELFPERSE